ncbi:hypothetical protein WDZ92_48685, partial [Nostoc sp. NIES-2111]
MTATRPALRLLQALLGLLLLVGAWQVSAPAPSLAGVAAGGWTQAEGGLAALTDADGGWIAALADDGAPDLFDDGADPDEAATLIRSATAEPRLSEGTADRVAR